MHSTLSSTIFLRKIYIQTLSLKVLILLLLTLCGQIQHSDANRHHIINFTTTSAAAICPTSSSHTVVSGGLINLGNTCYLNAQLECAYHIPKVRNLIIDFYSTSTSSNTNYNDNQQEEEEEEAQPNIALLSLQQLFKEMYKVSPASSVSTNLLCHNLGINVYEQQDSQEFWKLLLPEINYNPLTTLYKGQYESYITALDGSGREKKRDEIFLDLSLDVTNFDSVDDSLEDMFRSAELLSVKEGNGWRPEKGAEKVDALKGCTITKDGLPHILQLHLMRFTYDMISGGMSKINDRFVFPLHLDLTSICKEDGSKAEKSTFELQSIVVHAGEYGSGHYYAYVRPDIRKNQWYRFDDDRVTPVSYKEVKNDAFGGHVIEKVTDTSNQKGKRGILQRLFARKLRSYGWGGRSSSAYMLQYVKKSEIPSLYNLN